MEGRSGERVRFRVKTRTGEQTIEGFHILVAAGRTPNTRDIGLEDATFASCATISQANGAPLGAGSFPTAPSPILTHPTMAEGLNVLLTNDFELNAYQAARALARWEGERGRVNSPASGNITEP